MEIDAFGWCMAGTDARKGTAAVLEKLEAVFTAPRNWWRLIGLTSVST